MDLATGLTLFLLLGVAQGLFLAVLLLTRRENATANRLLAAAMLAFAVFLAEVALYTSGRYREFPHLIGVSQPVIYLFGPVIYLYARRVTDGPGSLGRGALLHFLPAAAVVLWFLPFYLKSGPEKIAFVETLMRDGAPLDLEIVEVLKLPHGAAYTWITFDVLRRHRRRLEDHFSTLDRINLEWLHKILIGAMVSWGVAIVGYLAGLLGLRILGTDFNPVSLVLVVFVYAIGILGLRQPEVFWPPHAGGDPEAAPEPDAAAAKYRKSGLDGEKAAAVEEALLSLMEEQRPQEDPGLTLPELAERLGVSPHNLSEVINARLGTSFHDFVNGYRVEEAKRRLLDPELEHLTVLAIALDSGFRSKSTFNKIFKRFTGMTPSRFRGEHPGA